MKGILRQETEVELLAETGSNLHGVADERPLTRHDRKFEAVPRTIGWTVIARIAEAMRHLGKFS